MLSYNLTVFNHFKCMPTLIPLRRLIKIYLLTIADGKKLAYALTLSRFHVIVFHNFKHFR